MEVVVSSRERVKPSCPTGHHHSRFQLSFLDQLQYRTFTPFVYFYPSVLLSPNDSFNSTAASRLIREQLKKSLEKTLTAYYPLAGRIKEDQAAEEREGYGRIKEDQAAEEREGYDHPAEQLYIDCNDEGVPYFEALASFNLSQLVDEQPSNTDEIIRKLLPYGDRLHDAGDVLLGIQVTIFLCGGISIGLCYSHKIMDAASMIAFTTSWAATSLGDPSKMVVPDFGTISTLFSPRKKMPFDRMASAFSSLITTTKDKIVAKRFVFSSSAISAFKSKYGATNPSRIEALSVFIWARFVAATTDQRGTGGSTKKWHRVIHYVNLRPRADSLLSEYSFGNLSRMAMAESPWMDGGGDATISEVDCCGLLMKMREAIRKVDGDYVRELQEGNRDPLGYEERLMKWWEGMGSTLSFSAINRFPLYEVDFGWGRPIWVTLATYLVGNMVYFFPTRSGDGGIEAMVNLTQEDMAKLEADEEFISFVSPNSPKVLIISSSV